MRLGARCPECGVVDGRDHLPGCGSAAADETDQLFPLMRAVAEELPDYPLSIVAAAVARTLNLRARWQGSQFSIYLRGGWKLKHGSGSVISFGDETWAETSFWPPLASEFIWR